MYHYFVNCYFTLLSFKRNGRRREHILQFTNWLAFIGQCKIYSCPVLQVQLLSGTYFMSDCAWYSVLDILHWLIIPCILLVSYVLYVSIGKYHFWKNLSSRKLGKLISWPKGHGTCLPTLWPILYLHILVNTWRHCIICLPFQLNPCFGSRVDCLVHTFYSLKLVFNSQ